MAVKIRLARAGAKKRPFYRIVAADARSPRDGRFLEKLGTYDPLLETANAPGRIVLKRERIEYWLSVGASATPTVRRIIRRADAQG
jgi:small subunit ribosomal protein S16